MNSNDRNGDVSAATNGIAADLHLSSDRLRGSLRSGDMRG